jgi:hypothetical protein
MVSPGGTTAPARRRTDMKWRGAVEGRLLCSAVGEVGGGLFLWAFLGLHRRVVVEFFWAGPGLQPPQPGA